MLVDAVFTETEIAILNHLPGKPQNTPPKNVAHYLAVAKLGGHLARNNDGPPREHRALARPPATDR